MRKKRNILARPALLFSASAVLLLMSTVGSTRAALEYQSAAYNVEVSVSSIGVSLLEEGKVVSYRNYTENDDWSEAEGKLLDGRFGTEEGQEKLVPGKTYGESLSVMNSGAIDSYVRVILTRSWKDADQKATDLDPELIGLGLDLDGSGWIEDTASSTKERIVLYYTRPLRGGDSREETPAFCDSICLSPSLMTDVTTTEASVDGGKVITASYRYNGYSFDLAAEVDAVQTHNAEDAIKSAWGVDVSIGSDGTLSLR